MKNQEQRKTISAFTEKMPKKVIKFLKPTVITVLAAIFVVGSVWLMYNKQKNKPASVLEPPKALAADMPGWWYDDYFGSSVCEKEICKTEMDPDNDKLTNGQEYFYKTNPMLADTNGNGKTDGEDVANGLDPSNVRDLTFEQAASDDEIVGESLVFADEMDYEFSTMIDPKKVPYPDIADSSLRIITQPTDEASRKYENRLISILNTYVDPQKLAGIKEVVDGQDPVKIAELKSMAEAVAKELRGMDVPKDYLLLHKYTITFFELLPIVIYKPNESIITNVNDPYTNRWSDATQEFMVNFDRLNVELEKLKNAKK